MKELLVKLLEEQGFFANFETQIEPEIEIKKGEKIVGEMNDLEKACFNLFSQKEKEYDELLSKMQKADEAGDYDTLEGLKPEYSKMHVIMNLSSKIMWASVKSRITTSEESTGTAIRKGFQIVETYEEEHCGSAMIIPGLGALISMRM